MQTWDEVEGLHNCLEFSQPLVFTSGYANTENVFYRLNDNVSMNLIKESSDIIILPLTCIINLSITSGIVPKQLNIARVILACVADALNLLYRRVHGQAATQARDIPLQWNLY